MEETLRALRQQNEAFEKLGALYQELQYEMKVLKFDLFSVYLAARNQMLQAQPDVLSKIEHESNFVREKSLVDSDRTDPEFAAYAGQIPCVFAPYVGTLGTEDDE